MPASHELRQEQRTAGSRVPVGVAYYAHARSRCSGGKLYYIRVGAVRYNQRRSRKERTKATSAHGRKLCTNRWRAAGDVGIAAGAEEREGRINARCRYGRDDRVINQSLPSLNNIYTRTLTGRRAQTTMGRVDASDEEERAVESVHLCESHST